MKKYNAAFLDNKFVVFDGETTIGSVEFNDRQMVSASIIADGIVYSATRPASTGWQIIISAEGKDAYTFAISKLWGSAMIYRNGESTGYKMGGRFLKVGTRLIAGDKDLIVVRNKSSFWGYSRGLDIEVHNQATGKLLLILSVYYHIYASVMKTRVAL